VPTIRDGRGVLTEHRLELATNPPGPVERAQVSAARMADIAAERAAAAARRTPMPAQTLPGNGLGRFPLPRDKQQRATAVIEALRMTSSVREAAEKLGSPAPAGPRKLPRLPGPPLDVVSLDLTVSVTAAELATWRPERISRFFAGIAIVTAARWSAE
jgi:hypothetical protein